MILIVDDKAENIYSLKALLSIHSFPVDTATSGEEALKKILANAYALIILDVQMPGMDGFEVAEILSGYSKSKDIPIIFLTAVNTDKKYITRGYSSGGVDYITKPIDPDILLLKVKTLFRLYEQSRQMQEMHIDLVQEVENRKKAKKEADEKAAEFRSILESIPQIAFTTSAEGTLEFTNSKWLDYATGTDDFPPVHEEDEDLRSALLRHIPAGLPIEMEVRIKHREGGDWRYHLIRVMPVRENDKVVKWAGTFTDIEDQKQAVQKKDEFISIASHELKTPLTSIKAYLQLLQREAADKNPFSLYVDRTLTQVKKLDGLIAELLDISKLESGKLVFDQSMFDFESMLTAQIEMFKRSYPDYLIERTGFVQAPVYGNESRLEQVVTNFINNAIKYSPEERKVIVDARIKDNELSLSVTDFGIGISETDQKKLFNKFYRAPQAVSSFQGMGIGLYICAEIIRRHGGQYGVTSEPGKGSTFYFSIPLKKEA